jgi:hypothetical protein
VIQKRTAAFFKAAQQRLDEARLDAEHLRGLGVGEGVVPQRPAHNVDQRVAELELLDRVIGRTALPFFAFSLSGAFAAAHLAAYSEVSSR